MHALFTTTSQKPITHLFIVVLMLCVCEHIERDYQPSNNNNNSQPASQPASMETGKNHINGNSNTASNIQCTYRAQTNELIQHVSQGLSKLLPMHDQHERQQQ